MKEKDEVHSFLFLHQKLLFLSLQAFLSVNQEPNDSFHESARYLPALLRVLPFENEYHQSVLLKPDVLPLMKQFVLSALPFSSPYPESDYSGHGEQEMPHQALPFSVASLLLVSAVVLLDLQENSFFLPRQPLPFLTSLYILRSHAFAQADYRSAGKLHL